MENKPKLKLKLTYTDKTIEIVGYVLIILVWVYVLKNYHELPEIIPTHYNGYGNPDLYGSKKNILMLPLIATILYTAITYLNNFPHTFNYSVEITAENALSQYLNATRMFRFLKIIIILIFGLIAFVTINNNCLKNNNLGTWFLPFTLVLIFIAIVYFLMKSHFSKVK